MRRPVWWRDIWADTMSVGTAMMAAMLHPAARYPTRAIIRWQRLTLRMMFDNLQNRARALKTELVALCYAARDPRTPWYARLVMLATLAYAASPIDLIPDFIPILGYLDDLILVPAGIALSIRLIPAQVMQDARQRAATTPVSRRANWLVGGLVLVLWMLALAVLGRFGWAWWQARNQP